MAVLALVTAGCTGRCDRATGPNPLPAPAPAPVPAPEDASAADASTPQLPLGLTHPYQPIHEGDTRTYQTTHSGTMALVSTSTERVVSVERGIDRVVARISDTQDTTSTTSEHSMILTPLGISPDIGMLRFTGGSVSTLSTTGVYLPMDLALAHEKWSYTQVLGSSEVKADAEVVGIETVSVPAGEYQAVHVKGELMNGRHTQHEHAWYARDVGLVKSVTATKTGYRAEMVLVSFKPGASP